MREDFGLTLILPILEDWITLFLPELKATDVLSIDLFLLVQMLDPPGADLWLFEASFTCVDFFFCNKLEPIGGLTSKLLVVYGTFRDVLGLCKPDECFALTT